MMMMMMMMMITIIIVTMIIIIIKGLIPTLAWLTCACLNWLVRTGHCTVWRDKSPKATVTSFIVQIQVAGLSYWLP